MATRKKARWIRIALMVVIVLIVALSWRMVTTFFLPTQTGGLGENKFAFSSAMGGDLGIVLLDIQSEETARHYHVAEPGVYVLEADENAAAYQAGIRSGDRIVSCNGQKVNVSSDLDSITLEASDDQAAEFIVFRSEKQRLLTITISREAAD